MRASQNLRIVISDSLFWKLQPQKALLFWVIRELNQAGERIKKYFLLNTNPLLDSDPSTDI